MSESVYTGSILYKSSEHQYKKRKTVSYSVYDDIKLINLFDYCCRQYPDGDVEDEIKYTLDIIRTPCQSKEDILFRQQIFKQLLEKPDNSKKLYDLFKDIQILKKIRENYDNTDLVNEDSEYIKVVNYIFFIKSYQLFIVSIKNFLMTLNLKENEGLDFLYEYIKSEIAEINNKDILNILEDFLSLFDETNEIISELPYIRNTFTEWNFDYKNDYKNFDVEHEHFITNLKDVEDFLQLKNTEKDHKFVDISDFQYIRHSPNYSSFEKRAILNILETVNSRTHDFRKKMEKIKEVHDKIDISSLVTICEQLKFYSCMCKVINFLNDNSDNYMCFPIVSENGAKAKIKGMFDPIVLIQKHIEQKELSHKNPHHKFNIGEVVTNNISFNDTKVFVITGANNGGKTSFVRGLGISVLFYGAGCAVPARQASFQAGLTLYTHFVAEETHTVEGGRLQDELRRVEEILNDCDKDGIVILNETYSGTNAIKALSLFDDFLKRAKSTGITGFFVTHFHNIALHIEKQSERENGEDKENIYLICENMKAMVDERTGKRTYKVVPYKPSDSSHSREIVEKYKLSWRQLAEHFNIPVKEEPPMIESEEQTEQMNVNENENENEEEYFYE